MNKNELVYDLKMNQRRIPSKWSSLLSTHRRHIVALRSSGHNRLQGSCEDRAVFICCCHEAGWKLRCRTRAGMNADRI